MELDALDLLQLALQIWDLVFVPLAFLLVSAVVVLALLAESEELVFRKPSLLTQDMSMDLPEGARCAL